MSKIADKVAKLLKKEFSNHRVVREHYVVYSGNKLFFDFFIPELKILIEVQGDQHYVFNSFFHKDNQDLKQQKYRDTLKTQWVEDNSYKLLTLNTKEIEDLTSESFRKMIIDFI
jgi:very-short-patch-repair endonuclease